MQIERQSPVLQQLAKTFAHAIMPLTVLRKQQRKRREKLTFTEMQLPETIVVRE